MKKTKFDGGSGPKLKGLGGKWSWASGVHGDGGSMPEVAPEWLVGGGGSAGRNRECVTLRWAYQELKGAVWGRTRGRYSSFNVQYVTDTRETSLNVEEARIIRRTEDKQKIMASLSKSITQDITILPIYGIGGIGKKTLAKLVFNDIQCKDYSQVWVYVSQTFDSNKIGNSIVSQVSGRKAEPDDRKGDGKQTPWEDDLCEKDPCKLDELKSMLKVGEGGEVVVIITTRDEGIEKNICTIKPYKIRVLDK
uniref:Putative disease resistance protein n=1 Tax=Phyllostachys edulis TaxID=38705 RepID=D3IVP2_PHYED|nr:putative disease resistance protein [Phyllostachys edulis]